MTKKEIEDKIILLSLESENINIILNEVFETGLDYNILENYNGFDPMDTVVEVVTKILNDKKEEILK